MKLTSIVLPLFTLCCITASAQKKYTIIQEDSFITIKNTNGQTLCYSPSSGIKILTVDGFAFKDLDKNGKLDKYEDWRLPFDVRAKDLATKMSIEQIAGLMLYSRHQPIPNPSGGPFAGTYYETTQLIKIKI